MNDPKSEQEPSMEEILASIRRIISEDDEEKPAEDDSPSAIEDEEEPLIAEAAAPEPAPEEEAETTPEDVFELTQEVQDDGTVVDLATGRTVHENEVPELVEVEELDVAPGPEPASSFARLAAAMEEEEGLVGPPASAASTASFEQLATTVAGRRTDLGGRTVEEVVKDVVRPIVKDWLDANLPDLVERLVQREIERMTRKAEDSLER